MGAERCSYRSLGSAHAAYLVPALVPLAAEAAIAAAELDVQRDLSAMRREQRRDHGLSSV